jgi:threonine/homoserine/homoserine lactone efflux protein
MLFCAASLGLFLSPGPNMALVVSQALVHGPRGGVAVASGIVIADLLLTVLVASGVAALVATWPPSFDVLRYAGAGYLVWLALKSLRRRQVGDQVTGATRSTASIIKLSVVTSLLNPKALLFFLVFLPQFVEPARGHVGLQLLGLGVVLAATAFVFHAALGVMSAQTRAWASGRWAGVVWLDRLQAAVFFGIALRLVLLIRPA